MIINLDSKAPSVQCKLGKKLYRIYANDKNQRQIEKILGFYFEQQAKINDLDEQFEAAQKNKDAKSPISPTEFKKITSELITGVKKTFIEIFDTLLNEKGVGEEIWRVKNGSTEYLVFALQEIQAQLKAEQAKYEKDRKEAIEKEYSVHKSRAVRHRNSSYKK
ncbi:hypothetical protein [Oenococcus sicerae]|uniref:hypothetical protein n=1 Tax=Oenococcus sicerae TaxID=2203724 RepID=UPI0039E96741